MHLSALIKQNLNVYVIMIFGEVTKSMWWMPWHEKAMKDAVTCDKLR